ncbi:hypothetical protein HK097_007218 [Rhizophlyctis rosea]|uniref:RING-type E3 ubiquitin transferase n=1 Tax=Rhizophlyctis rosea TaxID=64517 RepID=A0AAD5SE26_9FUNG|nr:hypothetical protein HK097_007218 [Rhizophlyctis rosea]
MSDNGTTNQQTTQQRPLSTVWLVLDSLWNLSRLSLLIAFSAVYSPLSGGAECDTPLQVFLIGAAVVVALYSLPQSPLIYWTDRNPLYKYHPVVKWIRKFWRVFSLVDWCWSVSGQVWTFRSKTCKVTNPHVYWLAVSEIIIFYMGVVLPIFVIMVLFCIYGTALFTGRGLRGALEGPGGLTPLELSRLPTFSFHMPEESGDVADTKAAGGVDEEAGRKAGTGEEDREGTSSSEESSVVEVIVENGRPSSPSTPAPTPTSPATKQSVNSSAHTCSICFCDYEAGERLRELACGHRFHKECIDPWLLPDKAKKERGHRTCPLCVKEAIKPEDRDPKWVKLQKRREAEERRLRPQMDRALQESREEAERAAAAAAAAPDLSGSTAETIGTSAAGSGEEGGETVGLERLTAQERQAREREKPDRSSSVAVTTDSSPQPANSTPSTISEPHVTSATPSSGSSDRIPVRTHPLAPDDEADSDGEKGNGSVSRS